MTNYEGIQSMNIDQLAELISLIIERSKVEDCSCYECIRKWLEKEDR